MLVKLCNDDRLIYASPDSSLSSEVDYRTPSVVPGQRVWLLYTAQIFATQDDIRFTFLSSFLDEENEDIKLALKN